MYNKEKIIKAKSALLPSGWSNNVCVEINDLGYINKVSNNNIIKIVIIDIIKFSFVLFWLIFHPIFSKNPISYLIWHRIESLKVYIFL